MTLAPLAPLAPGSGQIETLYCLTHFEISETCLTQVNIMCRLDKNIFVHYDDDWQYSFRLTIPGEYTIHIGNLLLGNLLLKDRNHQIDRRASAIIYIETSTFRENNLIQTDKQSTLRIYIWLLYMINRILSTFDV